MRRTETGGFPPFTADSGLIHPFHFSSAARVARVGILKWVNDAHSNPIVGRPEPIFSSESAPSITRIDGLNVGYPTEVLTNRNHLT